MPKSKNFIEPEVNIHIKVVANGVVINAHKERMDDDSPYRDASYVYKSLEEALKEVPAIVSVLRDGGPGKMDNTNKEMKGD